MCPKTSKTTPLLMIAGICFVIVLVVITGITLINNINLSNIIRLNEKVASDSVSNNENQIKELNYVNNHPRNVYLKLNSTRDDDDDDEDGAGNRMQREQEQLELPKMSAVIGDTTPKIVENQLKKSQEIPPSTSATPPAPTPAPTKYAPTSPLEATPPLPFGGVKTNGSSGGLIDYEKRNQVVKVSQGLKAVCLSG